MTPRDVVWVFGGRNYDDKDAVVQALTRYLPRPGGLVLQGGASGAFMLAKNLAHTFQAHPVTVPYYYPAGGAGGPMRNEAVADIAEALLDAGHIVRALHFPGGSGTADSLDQAHVHNLTVVSL